MMRSLYILGLFLGMYVCMSVPSVVVDFSSQDQRQSDINPGVDLVEADGDDEDDMLSSNKKQYRAHNSKTENIYWS